MSVKGEIRALPGRVAKIPTRIWKFFWGGHIPRLAVLMFGVMFVGAFIVQFIERAANDSFQSLGGALWWAMITMTTVGYGDMYPQTSLGRLITGGLVFSGMALISVFTATIASVLTARRIREGRGLGKLDYRDHIVLCGWNDNAEKVIRNLIRLEAHRISDIVLVNDLPEDTINDVLLRYQEEVELKYVQGDFVHESVLHRANIREAQVAIILADVREDRQGKADDRTILATLAIKSLGSDVRVCAEILDGENAQHLRRADVDEIIIRGEYSGSLLASATSSPGIPEVVRELMDYESGNKLWRSDIPKTYVGRSFGELFEHFRKAHGTILVGIISEEQGMTMEDVLSDDFSVIDQFIKQKFSEAGKESLFEEGRRTEVKVNPSDDYEISENDAAVVISRMRVKS